MYNRQRIKALLTLLGGALFVLLMFGSCEGFDSIQYSPPEQQGDKGGIKNVGNTCYINSTLQILAALYANKVEEATTTLTDEEDAKAKQLAVTCHKVIEGINANKFVGAEDARAFQKALQKAANLQDFTTKRQGDLREVFECVFDSLKFDSASRTLQYEDPDTNKKTDSTTENLWNILPIELQIDKKGAYPTCITMQNFLDNYFLKEKGTREFRLNGIKNVDCIVYNKLTKLDKLTNGVLPIYFKRACYDSSGEKIKLSTKIKDAFTLAIEGKTWRLVGFVNQDGGIGGGHYVAWVYKGGKWYFTSDSYVREKTEGKAKEAAEDGYLFFYK